VSSKEIVSHNKMKRKVFILNKENSIKNNIGPPPKKLTRKKNSQNTKRTGVENSKDPR